MEPSIQNYRRRATLPTLRASVGAERSKHGLRAIGEPGAMRHKLRQPTTARSTTAGLRSRPLAEMRSPEAQRRGNSTRPQGAWAKEKRRRCERGNCTRAIALYRLTLELSGRCRDEN